MQKKCIGCKREISWGNSSCPFCGAAQSRLRHYGSSLALAIIVLAALGWVSHKSFQSLLEQSKQQLLENNQQQVTAANERIQALVNQIAELESQLKSAQQNNQQLKENQSAKSDERQSEIQTLKSQLASAQKETEKQEGRASWLGRENNRLKSELNSLKSELAALKTSNESQSSNSQSLLPADPPTVETTPESSDDETNNR
ncbi:hypothetical protein [Pleionea sediminis]|uniref:hypothetical protein n=1 Tax=Pleionea sediminis TaxID=2569479 RepID=UPI001185155A|nr:hypothetical protein [Pleionea sediminis]